MSVNNQQQEPKAFEYPAHVLEGQPEEAKIVLNNIDVYSDAIKKFREKMVELVRNGVMAEQTAARIILEQEYNFYQQIVNIEYQQKKEQG